jgi:DNA polymerase
MKLMGYDTETWSPNQISKGLEHYFDSPDFAIICDAWADDQGSQNNEGPAGPLGGINCAHNMPFDRQAVENHFTGGIFRDVTWFDTMVGVRAILGASAGRNTYMSLDKSAKLLLPEEFHKDPNGANYMPWFSFPSETNRFGKITWQQAIKLWPKEWQLYKEYCEQDARVALELAKLTKEYLGDEAFERLVYEAELTYRMNRVGWPVDKHLLQVMTDRAQENTEQSIDNLIAEYNPGWSTVKKNGDELFKPLNINSSVQLRKWLLERDIDVDDTTADTITETIEMVEDNLDLRPDWVEVLAVLQAKVDRGGATLKKLEPIKNGLSADGRLRDMYNHIGASATHRTTGSKAQMQNLKRLPDDVEDLTEDGIKAMNNGDLARNIRQLFKAESGGQIIVADLKSIEGLLVGWVFGVDWMVEAVRDGKDMYAMNAATRFRVPYLNVLPPQRRRSKTGVLAGNYGGGTKAYMKSDPTLDETTAKAEVAEYRSTVPNLVQSWWDLNDMILEAVDQGNSGLRLFNGYSVTAEQISCPFPDINPNTSLEVTMLYMGKKIFSRLWHGVTIELDDKGRSEVTYAVADERKTAVEPWKRETSTKPPQKFKLYGGKLTGTLIQSLARELYFYQMQECLSAEVNSHLIGQLHDEAVAEWQPHHLLTLEATEDQIEWAMTQVPWYLENCPVKVKVSHAPRYIK